MPDARIPAQELSLAEAFSALPLEAPERSAWPQLAARIDAAQKPARADARFRRWLFAGAAAAAIAAVAVMPREIAAPFGVDATPAVAGTPPAAAATPDAAPAAFDVDSLMAESARLEYVLQQVGNDGGGSASAMALTLELEARVQQLDVALSDPALTAEQRTDLWSRRVGLLRDYVAVQGTEQWLATQGQDYDGDLVAVY